MRLTSIARNSPVASGLLKLRPLKASVWPGSHCRTPYIVVFLWQFWRISRTRGLYLVRMSRLPVLRASNSISTVVERLTKKELKAKPLSREVLVHI